MFQMIGFGNVLTRTIYRLNLENTAESLTTGKVTRYGSFTLSKGESFLTISEIMDNLPVVKLSIHSLQVHHLRLNVVRQTAMSMA